MTALVVALALAGGLNVTVFELQVDGDAAAVAPALAKRFGASGAHGELVVAPGRLWLVAQEVPRRLALAQGRLRFMPVAEKPGPSTVSLVQPGTPPRTSYLQPDPAKHPAWVKRLAQSLPSDMQVITPAEGPGPGIDEVASSGRPDRTWHVQPSSALHAVPSKVEGVLDQFGRPQVQINLNPEASAELHALTKRLVGKPLAVVIDQRVLSVPTVREPISGGRVLITLGAAGSIAEAERLAAQLRAGPLRAPVRLLRTAAATRADADGTTTVSGTPLRYPTPKRWHPAACALSQRADCRVLVVPAAR